MSEEYFKIDWTEFRLRYLHNNEIYALELEDRFCFYTAQGVFKIKCEVIKDENPEKNIIFISRFFSEKKNVVRLIDIETGHYVQEKEEIYNQDVKERFEKEAKEELEVAKRETEEEINIHQEEIPQDDNAEE